MIKRIAILGSTGSIGTSALKVIDSLGRDFSVVALSAHSNSELLVEQALRYHPRCVAVTDESKVEAVAKKLSPLHIEVLSGAAGMTAIAELGEVDLRPRARARPLPSPTRSRW